MPRVSGRQHHRKLSQGVTSIATKAHYFLKLKGLLFFRTLSDLTTGRGWPAFKRTKLAKVYASRARSTCKHSCVVFIRSL